MGLGIDFTNVQEQGSPVPDGVYTTVVDKAEVVATKSGGEMIKVNLKIVEGPQEGRVIFDQFNIKNANPMAVQIGLGQLKRLIACGGKAVAKLESANELLGLRVSVKTKIEEQEGYQPSARVRGYAPVTLPASQAATGSNPFA